MSWSSPPADRTRASYLAYETCRRIIVFFARLAWRVRVLDRDRVPASGPVILAPTHRSLLDIPLMAFVTARPARFMAKEELFKRPAMGRLLQFLGAFPVRRGAADRAALAEAKRVLDAGAPLVVFPEGTRGRGSLVAPIEDGVAYMAMKAGAPIIPIGVAGTGEILRKGRFMPRFTQVTIAVGNPIPVDLPAGRIDRVQMRAILEQVQAGLQHEFDRAQALLQ